MNSTFNILQNGGSSQRDGGGNQLAITNLVARRAQLIHTISAQKIVKKRGREWVNKRINQINMIYGLLRQFYWFGSDGDHSNYMRFTAYLTKGLTSETSRLLRSDRAGGVSVVADLETLIQLVKPYQFDVTGRFVSSAERWLEKRELSKLEASLARDDADMKRARGGKTWPRNLPPAQPAKPAKPEPPILCSKCGATLVPGGPGCDKCVWGVDAAAATGVPRGAFGESARPERRAPLPGGAGDGIDEWGEPLRGFGAAAAATVVPRKPLRGSGAGGEVAVAAAARPAPQPTFSSDSLPTAHLPVEAVEVAVIRQPFKFSEKKLKKLATTISEPLPVPEDGHEWDWWTIPPPSTDGPHPILKNSLTGKTKYPNNYAPYIAWEHNELKFAKFGRKVMEWAVPAQRWIGLDDVSHVDGAAPKSENWMIIFVMDDHPSHEERQASGGLLHWKLKIGGPNSPKYLTREWAEYFEDELRTAERQLRRRRGEDMPIRDHSPPIAPESGGASSGRTARPFSAAATQPDPTAYEGLMKDRAAAARRGIYPPRAVATLASTPPESDGSSAGRSRTPHPDPGGGQVAEVKKTLLSQHKRKAGRLQDLINGFCETQQASLDKINSDLEGMGGASSFPDLIARGHDLIQLESTFDNTLIDPSRVCLMSEGNLCAAEQGLVRAMPMQTEGGPGDGRLADDRTFRSEAPAELTPDWYARHSGAAPPPSLDTTRDAAMAHEMRDMFRRQQDEERAAQLAGDEALARAIAGGETGQTGGSVSKNPYSYIYDIDNKSYPINSPEGQQILTKYLEVLKNK
mgnify:CR=1 FL=1